MHSSLQMNEVFNLEASHLIFFQGQWNTFKAKGATRVRGLTLGIIGFGKIGKAVAVRYLSPFCSHQSSEQKFLDLEWSFMTLM